MKIAHQLYILTILMLLAMVSCSDESDSDLAASDSGSSSTGSGDEEPQQNEGLITAGEWNDLDNWDFWKEVIEEEDFAPNDRWGIMTTNRVSVQVVNGSALIVDVPVDLILDLGQGTPTMTLWSARTDNFGRAEMWLAPYIGGVQYSLDDLAFSVAGNRLGNAVRLYEEGVITLIGPLSASTSSQVVDLSFIVDATSSMADELEFIKDDLEDVIERVEEGNSVLDVRTSTVVYRDEGDEYLVRQSDFTEDLGKTLQFIDDQSAGGGGDFPEAVHTGLETAISQLDWSREARSRIAFLILDAPPHEEAQVSESIRNQIKEAARLGIKIIPITASGIDKPTELLMRQMAILTNGTYVFITNDSGIGEDHIEASVGEYEVEFLNDLMVRLIKKYTD